MAKDVSTFLVWAAGKTSKQFILCVTKLFLSSQTVNTALLHVIR